MKTRREGLVLPVDRERRLEARHLAAERVPLHLDVDQPEPLAVEHDHPGAGAEDRGLEGADRVVEPVQPHQARHRRRLAARDDQPVEPLELLRQAHLDDLGPEPAQHRDVLAERSLQGQDADLHDQSVPARAMGREALRTRSASGVDGVDAPAPLVEAPVARPPAVALGAVPLPAVVDDERASALEAPGQRELLDED